MLSGGVTVILLPEGATVSGKGRKMLGPGVALIAGPEGAICSGDGK